jgi:hypothetical protein
MPTAKSRTKPIQPAIIRAVLVELLLDFAEWLEGLLFWSMFGGRVEVSIGAGKDAKDGESDDGKDVNTETMLGIVVWVYDVKVNVAGADVNVFAEDCLETVVLEEFCLLPVRSPIIRDRISAMASNL